MADVEKKRKKKYRGLSAVLSGEGEGSD